MRTEQSINTLQCEAALPRRNWRMRFWLQWTFIAGVSVYDALMVVQCREVIQFTEQSLICLKLIQMDPEGLSYFLTAKLGGTLVVLWALRAIAVSAARYRDVIVTSIAAFQGSLLLYLLH